MYVFENLYVDGLTHRTTVWFKTPVVLPMPISGRASISVNDFGVNVKFDDNVVFVPSSNIVAVLHSPIEPAS